MPFDTKLRVEREACHKWQLLAPVTYRASLPVEGGVRSVEFTIPAGFVTDWASVPRLLQSFIPRTGQWDEAAALHDLFCEALNKGRPLVDSRTADRLFEKVMKEAGVKTVRRKLMWTGVRWGALANKARRAGWLKDAPAVLAISGAAGSLAVGAVTGTSWTIAQLLGF
jgi:Protein of unknown function (DUF1353)